MTFDKPTTKEEMYATLKEIYFYYNHKRLIFNNVEHEELSIPKMNFLPLTDSELTVKATQLLSHKHTREKEEKRQEILDKISLLITKKNDSVVQEEKLIASITERYKKSYQTIIEKTFKSGVSDSTITVDKIKDLEQEIV